MEARQPPDPEDAPSAVKPVAFGRYTILGKLGSGGMADALLAMLHGELGFHKLMVLKRMHASLASDRHFVKMFLDEARLAARLNHSNVVQTTEVGEVSGQYFIAMEYLEGQSLDRVARRFFADSGAIPVPMLLRVVCDALDGLNYAHELRDYDGTALSVVHRDVTPSNLFVTYDGLAKVLDFGIAKAATQDEATRTGMLKGKLAYMSPEQFHAEAIDCRSDVWSMGIVVWEMLTGRRLFKGPNDVATYKNITSAVVPPLSAYRANTPDSIDRVIARALDRDRAARYASAAEMRDALETVLARDLPRCSRADVSAEMRAVFGDTIEENRRVVREFVRLGTEHAGESLGLSSLGHLKPGAGLTLSPSLSLNARDLGIPSPPRRVLPTSEPQPSSQPPPLPSSQPPSQPPPASSRPPLAPLRPFRVPSLPSVPVFMEDGGDSSEPTQVTIKPFTPDRSPDALPEPPAPMTPLVPAVLQAPLEVYLPPSFSEERTAPEVLPEVEFEPVPEALVRRDRRARRMEALLGWVVLMALLGAVGGATYGLRKTLRKGIDEMLHGAPPDPALLGSFELTIQSSPAGARVREGSEELGFTPLQLTVRRHQVAAQPRRFVLESEGHQTTAAIQGNTLSPTATLTVTLAVSVAPPLPETPHVPPRLIRRAGHPH